VSDYWFQERYEGMFLSLHGHLSWVVDIDCSLCGETTSREEVDDK